jgi:hypothetical protein
MQEASSETELCIGRTRRALALISGPAEQTRGGSDPYILRVGG